MKAYSAVTTNEIEYKYNDKIMINICLIGQPVQNALFLRTNNDETIII